MIQTKDKAAKVVFALIVAAVFLPTILSARMNSENYLIEVDSINAGGGQSSSTNYLLNDAFGEIAAADSTSTNYQELVFISSYLFRVFIVTAPTTTSLAGEMVSASAQTATGSISGVEITDDGTAGWSATMIFSHFNYLAARKLLAGSNDTVTFSGTYDGTYGIIDPPGMYIVEITAGGVAGTALFKWTDPLGAVTENVTTTSSVVLSKGVSVNFESATYEVGDKWSAAVDVFPYTGLTVAPSTITIVSGETGVSAGSPETLTGSGVTSDPKTLMVGDSNNSAGTYQQDEGLELNVHANSLSGSFIATAILTIL